MTEQKQASTFERPMAQEMAQSILDAKPLIDGGWRLHLDADGPEVVLTKSDSLYRLRLPSGHYGYAWTISADWSDVEAELRKWVWWGGGLYYPR